MLPFLCVGISHSEIMKGTELCLFPSLCVEKNSMRKVMHCRSLDLFSTVSHAIPCIDSVTHRFPFYPVLHRNKRLRIQG